MPNLLYFLQKSDPILRKIMPKVQNFQDPKLHAIIEDMCYSILPKQLKSANADFEEAAGMAANQWGIEARVCLITPQGSGENKPLEIVINPSYTPYSSDPSHQPIQVADYEGCFSIPLTAGIVKRYAEINATYYNVKGEKITRIMSGWEARIFQHETDHLDGKLFDGKCDDHTGPECVKRFIFKDIAEMKTFWETEVRASRAANKN